VKEAWIRMILVVIAEVLHFLRIIVTVRDPIVDHLLWNAIAARREEEIIPVNGEDLPGETSEDLLVVLPEVPRHLHDVLEAIRTRLCSIHGKRNGLGWRIAAGSVWRGNLSGM
jgi:hypothetical protein